MSARRDGDDVRLRAGDDDLGRIRGSRIEIGDTEVTVTRPGERDTLSLVVGGRTPVLRIDPGGRKATWFVLSRARTRLARQRWQPLRTRWVMTRDVTGPAVLSVATTPLGTSVKVVDDEGYTQQELEALIAGALVVVLGIPAAAHADA